jgi:single-strand DNA-binding protein
MAQYLAKGRPVFIEGRLKLDSWQDQSGNKRSKMRVVVEGFQFIDSKGGGGGGGNAGGRSAPQREPAATSSSVDDDIPF